MAIWKERGKWRARVQVNQQTYYARRTFQFKNQAKSWVEQIKKELKQRKYLFTDDLQVYEVINKYLKGVKLNLQHKTLLEKQHDLQNFYFYFKDLYGTEEFAITDIKKSEIREFLNSIAEAVSNNAANKTLKNVKRFYSWLQEIYGDEIDIPNPVLSFRKFHHEVQHHSIVNLTDILKLQLVTRKDDFEFSAFITIVWNTAARRSEILRLNWHDDISFKDRTIRLGTRKNRTGTIEYRREPMNSDAYKTLKELKKRSNSNYLFPSFYMPDENGLNFLGEQRLNRKRIKVLKEAGIPPFTFHSLRTSAAVYLHDVQKVSGYEVKEVLRHKRQTTTDQYISDGYRRLENTFELLTGENIEKALKDEKQNLISKMSQKMSQKEEKIGSKEEVTN